MLKSLAVAITLVITCGVIMPHHAMAKASVTTVTATCKDGSMFTGKSKKGACKKHGGVASYQTAGAPAAGATTMAAPVASGGTMAPAQPPKVSKAAPTTAAMSAGAMGGGPGQVWVNSSTKVYHCQGDRYYGKTKSGSFMSESAAIAAGDKPPGGKACK